MIEDILKNIDSEIEILKEIFIYNGQIDFVNPNERNLIISTISSLKKSMKIINDSIPALLNEISLEKELELN